MELAQLRRILDCGLAEHRGFSAHGRTVLISGGLSQEHLDDRVVNDRQRLVLVAVVALCLGWLLLCRLLCLSDRAHWGHLPCAVSRGSQVDVRRLGVFLADCQPRRHGGYLVWRAVVYRRCVCPSEVARMADLCREMRHPHDPVDLAQLRQSTQLAPRQCRPRHPAFPELLSLLAPLATRPLVPRPQGQAPVHRQGVLRPGRGHCVLRLGHCPR